MQIFISSSCSKNSNILEAIEELATVGFKNIELSGGNDFNSYSKEGLLEIKNKFDLNFIVHNYFPPQEESFVLNIASNKKRIQEQSRKLISEAIDLSKAFSKNCYGLHAGYTNEMQVKTDSDGVFCSAENIDTPHDFQRAFLDSLTSTLPKGFTLALENSFVRENGTKLSLLSTPEQIFTYLDQYKETSLGLLLDLGHLAVTAHVLKFDKFQFLDMLFRKWISRIFEVHLSTSSEHRDTHLITDPTSEDVRFLAKHKNRLKHVPLVLEWQQADCLEAYKAYKKILPLLS